MAETKLDEQTWIDEVQAIVSEFTKNDDDLGELMLDHSQHYWDDCFDRGLTPQEALAGLREILERSDALAKYKADRQRQEDHSWWPYRLQTLLVKLAELGPQDTQASRAARAETDLLIEQIVARYRRSL